MTRVFISYSHADEALKSALDKHLAILVHSGLIEPWHDRMLSAGDDFAKKIDANLDSADIILLLVSHHFISSQYCYGIEMARALEREKAGEARVIPVILDHCLWDTAPFSHLIALPTDAKPITKFPNVNEGFTDVVRGIRKAAESLRGSKPPRGLDPLPAQMPTEFSPRSANLHVRPQITQRQKDQFVIEAFDYISRFFEGSLSELAPRNPDAGIETSFEKVDSGTFSAAIYRNGKKASECTISRKHATMGDIAYSRTAKPPTNSLNDCLQLQEKDGLLSFKPLMSGAFGRHAERREELGMEGAAQYFWDTFFEPLQRQW